MRGKKDLREDEKEKISSRGRMRVNIILSAGWREQTWELAEKDSEYIKDSFGGWRMTRGSNG